MKAYSLLLCLTVLVMTGMLYGQGGAVGTILGTVVDGQGAAVANADVEVTNIGTNAVGNNPSASNFGVVTNGRPGRVVQLGGKFVF